MKHNRIATGAAALSLAGLVAVAGVATSANAKSQIHSSDIANQTIHSVDIAAGGVGTSEIRNQSIQSVDIAAGGVGTSEIRNGSITTSDLSKSVKALLAKSAKPGATGKTGATGKQGAQGPAGAPGKAGAKGDTGATGVGLQGAVYRVENYKNGGGGSATVACADTEAESQKYIAIAGGVQGSTVDTQSADGFAVSSSFPGRMDWDTNTPKDGRLDGWIVLGNGKYTSTLKVWALCIPAGPVTVDQTIDLDN